MKKSPMLAGVLSLLATVLVLLITSSALGAQDPTPSPGAPDLFVGKYKGTVKSSGGSVDLRAEIKLENGKLFGSLLNPQGEQVFASSELTNGKLKIKLGAATSPEILTLELRDG